MSFLKSADFNSPYVIVQCHTLAIAWKFTLLMRNCQNSSQSHHIDYNLVEKNERQIPAIWLCLISFEKDEEVCEMTDNSWLTKYCPPSDTRYPYYSWLPLRLFSHYLVPDQYSNHSRKAIQMNAPKLFSICYVMQPISFLFHAQR